MIHQVLKAANFAEFIVHTYRVQDFSYLLSNYVIYYLLFITVSSCLIYCVLFITMFEMCPKSKLLTKSKF